MNNIEHHLKEIQDLISINKSQLSRKNIDKLNRVSLEIPPAQFNYDLSCNIAMVLGKSNKLNPKNLPFLSSLKFNIVICCPLRL